MRGYPEHLHELINVDLQESIYDEHLDVFEDEINEIEKETKKKMLEEYKNYPIVGDYEINIDPSILDPEIKEIINTNSDKE